MNRNATVISISMVVLLLALPVWAQEKADETAELAKKLANPIASLISVPIQGNLDFGIGSADATKLTVNIQPVIPFSLNSKWNLITRTIFPVIYAEAPADGIDSTSGLGDIVQSFFLSPKDPVGGWIMGAGPVMLYPSATEKTLGSDKWGAGPTAVILKQQSGFTYGLLANHIWSFAGLDDRNDISATLLQPFLAYQTKTYTTFGVNTESTYDWKSEQWTVPVNLTLAQMVKIGGMPIQFMLGGRYYADKPDGGPDWGLRFQVTFLFPK
ncbi:MAG: transporter [Deltaproteobacteria bacterium]|nr:transporter [Deltaproteobacteria bacterium]